MANYAKNYASKIYQTLVPVKGMDIFWNYTLHDRFFAK